MHACSIVWLDASTQSMLASLRLARRERGWKVKQAKRYAGAVKRSNLDVESRAVVRAREAEASIRRRAAWIAKEVRMSRLRPVLHAHAQA